MKKLTFDDKVEENDDKVEESYKEIKDLCCITKMDKKDLDLFKKVFLRCFNKVTGRPDVVTRDYTPHGWPHLKDLFSIVSAIFVQPIAKAEEEYSSKELLFLNLAVYFHDIGMHGKILDDSVRATHAQRAYALVKDLLSSTDDPSGFKMLCGKGGIECIARICGAHSDSNCGNTDLKLEKINLYTKPFDGGDVIIRERMLAAVLRLADELDICRSRIEEEYHEPVAEDMPMHLIESDLHWKLCDMFNMPQIKENKIQIVLYGENIGRPTKSNVFHIKKLELIYKHLRKVENSLKNDFINVLIGKNADSGKDKKYNFYQEEQIDKKIKGIPSYYANLEIQVVDDRQGEVKFWVDNSIELARFTESTRQIIAAGKKGHIIDHKQLDYLKDEKLCIYDYINLHNIIEPGHMQSQLDSLLMDTFGKLIDKIMEREKLRNEDILLIGIDSVGSLLATSLGMRKSIPILSYASKNKKSIYPNIELHQKIREEIVKAIEPKRHVFLISDMIYTFSSMANCIAELKLTDDKVTIFCLFDRKPFETYEVETRKNEYNNLSKSFKIYAINRAMRTNLIRSENCVCCMLKRK